LPVKHFDTKRQQLAKGQSRQSDQGYTGVNVWLKVIAFRPPFAMRPPAGRIYRASCSTISICRIRKVMGWAGFSSVLPLVHERLRESCLPEIGTYSLSGGRRLARQRASSDPTDAVQPRALASFRNRSALLLLEGDASAEMEQPRARHQTSVFSGERDWMTRNNPAHPAEGEKCS
jgi:hypothetical protein